jgi:hypothetical protein
MMNERIKNLIEKVTRVDVTVDGFGSSDYTHVFDKEKFAELIIAECIGLIVRENEGEASGDWGEGYTAGLDTAKLSIEEHFGVE